MSKRRRFTNSALSDGNSRFQLDVINQSSIISDSDLQDALAAIQKQIDYHFLPVWNIGASLNFAPAGSFNNRTPTVWVMDYSDDVSILGYHDISDINVPVGFAFAKSAEDQGESWTVTLDHEILEMISDPFANIAAEGQFIGQPAFFAYENCDPVEEDFYNIDGITLSNFVYPSWFINTTSAQYDYMGVLDAPFTLSSAGYFSYFRAIGRWIDVTNNSLLPSQRKSKFSRWMRRRKASDPHFQKKDAQAILYKEDGTTQKINFPEEATKLDHEKD